MKNIIVDYDGTLHDSIKIYAPAFREAYAYLVKQGRAEERVFKEQEISRWLGYNSKDMWQNFMPELSEELKDSCSRMIGRRMLELIGEGKASLYPKSMEVLQKLKDKEYRLIFLSNCKEEYLRAHRTCFDLNKYFDAFYCCETYDFKPKYEIYEIIKEQYKGETLIVGDRYQDIEIALRHNLFSIGCAYGYGSREELARASKVVFDVGEILDLL